MNFLFLKKKQVTTLAIAIAIATTLFTSSTLYAAECDSCSELQTISTNTAATADNTFVLSSIAQVMQELLETTTLAFFGQLPDIGNSMATFTTIQPVQDSAYQDQMAILSTIEKNYQGYIDPADTADHNYTEFFGDFLLKDSEDSQTTYIDPAMFTASSLFLNPAEAGYYTDTQKAAAEKYIQLLSGVALSTQRVPDKSWLKHENTKDKEKTRALVAMYYTFSAVQSMNADNLAYVYALNTGHDFSGELDNYEGTRISEAGLLKYIQLNKTENEDWYTQLGAMSVGAILKEQTIILAGAFLELTRIEQILRRQLAAQAAAASTNLFMTQSLVKLGTKSAYGDQ